MSVLDRLKHSWDAFFSAEEERSQVPYQYGPSATSRPDRPIFRIGSERTIVSAVYTRMAIDFAANRLEHCRLDANDQYLTVIKSDLNECFQVSPNIDQGPRQFRQDIALSLFTQGVIAIIPVQTTQDPRFTGSIGDVRQLRVGEVVEWMPEHVKVRVYNQKKGTREDIVVSKSVAAIVENPFYSVMNEPNSTLQRLIRKLSLLDNVDELSSSGKLDIIIQLPYVVKSETRKQQAEQRAQDLKNQLQNSTYGIAYADATEKITQLNRSVENNLLAQVQYLKEELYSELGLTPEIMNGTADDVAMLNYQNRTIEPLWDSVVEAMIKTFLTKTARTQGQSIMYFQNPLRMIPISQLAEIADVLSRNQIVTPNELRPALGLRPSQQPQANQLVNSNMPINKQITDQNITVEQVPNQEPLALPAGPSAQDQEDELDKTMAELGLT